MIHIFVKLKNSLLIFALFFVCVAASAEESSCKSSKTSFPPIYDIEKDGVTLGYLVGSIHHGYLCFTSFNAKFLQKIAGSNQVFFEDSTYIAEEVIALREMLAVSAPKNQLSLRLSNGTMVTMNRLFKLNKLNKKDVDWLDTQHPFIRFLSATSLCISRAIIPKNTESIDLQLVKYFAAKSGGSILPRSMESPLVLSDRLNQISIDQWIEIINFTAEKNSDLSCAENAIDANKLFSKLLDDWSIEEMNFQADKLMREKGFGGLFVDLFALPISRQNSLVQAVIMNLNATEKPTFVVGAAHLGGKSGLVKILTEKGFNLKLVNEYPVAN